MQADELMDVAVKTATLMEQFDRRSEAISRDNRQVAQELLQLADAIPARIGQSASSLFDTISDDAARRVRAAIDRPLSALNKEIVDGVERVGGMSRGLEAQINRLETLHRALVWKVFACVFGAIGLLALSAVLLGGYYEGQVRQNRIAADLLRAYNRADVRLCDGRLCANVDPGATHYGKTGEYVVVRPR